MSNATNDGLSFELERHEQSVTIGGEDYVLVELDGRLRDKYLNNLGGRLKHTGGGQQGVKNFEGLQASLIAMSLFRIEGGEREPVKMDVIQKWPACVVSGLFEAAKKLSALGNEDEDDQEGND